MSGHLFQQLDYMLLKKLAVDLKQLFKIQTQKYKHMVFN